MDLDRARPVKNSRTIKSSLPSGSLLKFSCSSTWHQSSSSESSPRYVMTLTLTRGMAALGLFAYIQAYVLGINQWSFYSWTYHRHLICTRYAVFSTTASLGEEYRHLKIISDAHASGYKYHCIRLEFHEFLLDDSCLPFAVSYEVQPHSPILGRSTARSARYKETMTEKSNRKVPYTVSISVSSVNCAMLNMTRPTSRESSLLILMLGTTIDILITDLCLNVRAITRKRKRDSEKTKETRTCTRCVYFSQPRTLSEIERLWTIFEAEEEQRSIHSDLFVESVLLTKLLLLILLCT